MMLITDLDSRQLAAVLAALSIAHRRHGEFVSMEHHSEIESPLSLDEINAFCERINCGGGEGERYGVLALSIAHLSKEDRELLQEAADDPDEWKVLSREPGFFVKLCDELDPNLRHGHSDTIKGIIQYAHSEGLRMIEFDCDAPVMARFKLYEY